MPSVAGIGYQKLFLTNAGEPVFFVELDAPTAADEAIMHGTDVFLRKATVCSAAAPSPSSKTPSTASTSPTAASSCWPRPRSTVPAIALIFSQERIGVPYCSAVANSTGIPSRTEAVGVTLLSANQFGLRTIDAPAGQFAYYLGL